LVQISLDNTPLERIEIPEDQDVGATAFFKEYTLRKMRSLEEAEIVLVFIDDEDWNQIHTTIPLGTMLHKGRNMNEFSVFLPSELTSNKAAFKRELRRIAREFDEDATVGNADVTRMIGHARSELESKLREKPYLQDQMNYWNAASNFNPKNELPPIFLGQ